MLAARSADYLESVRAEIDAAGGRALAVPTNLVERDRVDALVERTVSELGQIDILVNNAFRMDPYQPFEQVDLVKWRKVYDVNVWGALSLTQACIPALKESAAQRGDASIVFILSMSMRKIRAGEGGYSTSKGALHTAMQTLAIELGPSRVRVNAVAPGWIGGPSVDIYLQWQSEARCHGRRRARRDRVGDPARRDPAAGRHRALGRVLRVAVVARDHRPDPRRQRRRVPRIACR